MRICVFAGTQTGVFAEYQAAAEELGEELAARKITLVYGGGASGLMGTLANTMLTAGGKVIGVLPLVAGWPDELNHQGLTERITVASIHERKMVMEALADAFIVLPGGIGTFDELFTALVQLHLGLHAKPIGLFNVLGYFQPFLALLKHVSSHEFAPSLNDLFYHDEKSAALLDRLQIT